MIDTRLSMARLALEQLSRKDRLALVRDLGLIQPTNAGPAPEAGSCGARSRPPPVRQPAHRGQVGQAGPDHPNAS